MDELSVCPVAREAACAPALDKMPPSSQPIPDDSQSSQKSFDPAAYTKPFLNFISDNPTVFHAVDHFGQALTKAGYKHLSARDRWTSKIRPGGKYYTTRNGSALIGFAVGKNYEPGNGISIVAGHVDAITAKLKPVPKLEPSAGYVQLGVAPYAGGLSMTWWDRDLSIGGKVLVKGSDGKIETRLVKLDWPIARVPSLAVHFGAPAQGPFNTETQMVPIIGLESSEETVTPTGGQLSGFISTQPPRLVRAIASALSITEPSSIINWELELFDLQHAAVGGLDKEFIFAGRIDDKLCCYSAIEALIASSDAEATSSIRMVGCFDNEEIGSLERQGAKSNFMGATIDRICEALHYNHTNNDIRGASYHSTLPIIHSTRPSSLDAMRARSAAAKAFGPDIVNQTLANSFLVSSDVIHAVNPNFLNAYLPSHSPRLNVGVAISADANGHMATDSVSTALLHEVAERCGSTLQVFQVRNDIRSGGTIGPMTSSQLGVRTVDAGIPQLSMHSIRATTGSLDPGLGVKLFKGFYEFYEEVDAEFKNVGR